jgi:hypothetical protein
VLDSVPLTYGTDWAIDPDKITLHILGNACLVLKAAVNPTIDATFPARRDNEPRGSAQPPRDRANLALARRLLCL